MAKSLRFTWDPRKAAANVRKHGVTFEEAALVFGDPLALTIPDPDHSDEMEYREITLGTSPKRRVVVVAHTERDGSIRIISARLPTRREARAYQEGDDA